MKGSATIVYHYPCVDGGFAAYAAYKGLLTSDIVNIYFVPYNHREPPIIAKMQPTQYLYLLDCAGPSEDWLRECCSIFEYVTILDHHKTAAEMLNSFTAPNLTVVFDMNHSGAVLAWNHFIPRLDLDAEKLRNLLNLFLYVEDNDLWRHELPQSKEFTAGLSAAEINFCWDLGASDMVEYIESLCESGIFKNLTEYGAKVLEERNAKIRIYVVESFLVTLGNIPGIRGVEISESEHGITSQLGHDLALGSPVHIGAIYVDGRVSLRAVEGTDCTVVAKQYGGGGHAGAAGFGLTREQWDAAKTK